MSDENENLPTVVIPTRALADVKKQRQELAAYIKSELSEGVDFGTIPGCGSKPSLFKPGAEKLLNLFSLGSRIASSWRDIDHQNQRITVGYTMEVYHLASGKAISQCEGSANSMERKYSTQPYMNMLNTLMKMAQKRAVVGAAILAVHGSDFFTQDLEDDPAAFHRDAGPSPRPNPQANPLARSGAFCSVCGGELVMSKSGAGYYCPNFQKPSPDGKEHTRCKADALAALKANQAEKAKTERVAEKMAQEPGFDPGFDGG
jgi:hypothetical protein